jgi:hypothetical protein
MITVKATREGLVGDKTASGYIIDEVVSFVALPAVKALGKFVNVRNPRNSKETIAQVLDVGPWNINDDDYVFNNQRPLAEKGISISGKVTNNAGIDLGERVWKDLEMTDNDTVEWDFLLL